MSRWEPWLMTAQGKRDVRLIVTPPCRSIFDIQQFFHRLPVTHPHLVGEHIEFEEVPDSPALVVVPGRRDT